MGNKIQKYLEGFIFGYRAKGEDRLLAQIHILNDWMNDSAFKLGQNYRKR